MSFIETIERARALLERNSRLSLRALQREFDLDDETLEELVDELVDVQQVAVRDGKVIGWAGHTASAATPGPDPTSESARDPRDYTPKHLADKILRSKSALEGERKQVTVMFADVKGSMELAEQLDPEVWHVILDRFFSILSEGVHRFEGTVNQYTGDGIMALFGAPISHEDHAQRACYAALQLREEIARYVTEVKRDYGVGFSTRMGLHSGEVVVGRIGDDLRMDYTAQGHSVGLAQRMESLASPDTCYLTGATAALVQGYFELEDLGEFSVKGVAAPVNVHRLVGAGSAHTRFDISRARGLTRFVGRDSDMQTLEDALSQALEGNGQVVGVVADAGTGKSRLCFEFIERCRARGIRVNEGHAVAHGTNVPYLPMLEAFRDYYGINDGDPDRIAREKIAGRMLLMDEGFRDVLPVMFEFFGVSDPELPPPALDPDAKQRQLFSVLRRMVQRLGTDGETENLITLIEDLHWLDNGSEAFLEQWVDAIAGSSGLLLVNFRPEYHADWMQKSYYRQLPLAPLGPEAVRDLLEDLLGSDPSTEGLAEAIHQRTGGNPFFTEEVARSLIESGQLEGSRGAYRLIGSLEGLEVPPSVQGVLAARIDRLGEDEKRVVQAAAVIGREFSEPILEAAAELDTAQMRAALAELKSSEFIYEQALYPVAEYAFKHALTQEVALGSQLAERRQRTHANVARAIQSAFADKLDEKAALLAHHYEEGAEDLTAARWHQRAAEHAGRTDPIQSVRHMQRVLALTEADDDTDERSEMRLDACRSLLSVGGWRTGLADDEMERIYAEGRELARRVGSVEQMVGLKVGYAGLLGFAGDIRGYHREALEAAELIDESTSVGAAGWVHVGTAYSSFLVGRLGDALGYAELNCAISQGDVRAGVEVAGFSTWGQSLQFRAECEGTLGRLDSAWSMVEQALALSRQNEWRDPLIWSLQVSTRLALFRGDHAEQALRHGVEALEIAEKTGSAFQAVTSYGALASARLQSGAFEDAAAAMRQGLALAREHRTGLEREVEFMTLLARAQLGNGELASARATAEDAIARAREQGARFFEAQAELIYARVLTASGDLRDARLALEHARAGVAETGGRASEPAIEEQAARLKAEEGGDSRPGLERAQRLYAEIGAAGHADRLAHERASTTASS